MKPSYNISLKLALKELKHGWKHFGVFLACLVLGVTIMAAVNTLGSVVKNSLTNEAQSLLGGDMEIQIKGVQATTKQVEFLQTYGQVSYVATLRSMMHFNDQSTLIELKAIDAQYPLIGELSFNESTNDNPLTAQAVFAGKGVAIDPMLLSQLQMKLGDTVKIGSASFIIRATIKREPDRAVQIFNFGPRVMMSQASLDASGLVSTFSLVKHRYRVLTPKDILANDDYEQQVEHELEAKFPKTSWRVGTGTDGNQSLERFLNQLIAFMNLSGLATFLIAGIGIGSSARTYLAKKSPIIAVLKVQGASRRLILQTYTLVIGSLAIIGGLAGVIIAAIVTLVLVPILAEVIPSISDETGLYLPASLLALWYGVLIAYLFSIPALLSAVNIKPALLFRSKTTTLVFSSSKASHGLSLVLIILLCATLVYNASDRAMIAGTLGVICIAFGLFAVCTYFIKKLTLKIKGASFLKQRAPWLKLALGNIHRPGSSTGTVVFAIGISLTVLIALTLTEANFQKRIQDIAESRAPTLFIIDIQPQQKAAIKTLLREFAKPDEITLSPMVRGRITHLAGRPVADVAVDEDISWAIRGDRGISYSKNPPENANIVAGEWWPADYKGPPLLSVDERFIQGMDVAVGDTMTVKILGEDITATITNARKIDYSSFQLNFAMILAPGNGAPDSIEDFPHTSLATIYLDKDSNQEAQLIARLAQEFPEVMAIRTQEVIDMVQTVMGHIATALRLTVAVSLLAGVLVLTSALSSTIQQRMYDIAILKVLGASQSDILKSCSAEWLLLALITSVIASIIGTCAAMLINARLGGQEFDFMPEIILITVAVCMLIIWGIGYLGNRTLFNFRPASVLRNE